MNSLPTPGRFFETLGGRVYRPTLCAAEVGRLGSWGGSGAENVVRNLTLRFALEANADEISIESSTELDVDEQGTALGYLIFDVSQAGSSFPITLNRSERQVSVDGSDRSFTVYTAGSRAVAVRRIEEVRVVVRCPVRQLAQLSLERVRRAELAQILRGSRQT